MVLLAVRRFICGVSFMNTPILKAKKGSQELNYYNENGNFIVVSLPRHFEWANFSLLVSLAKYACGGSLKWIYFLNETKMRNEN